MVHLLLVKGNKLRKHFDRDSQNLGWLDEVTGAFYKDVPKDFSAILGTTDDSWVTLGTPVLEKLVKIYEVKGRHLVARGEISGVGLKGSGNKNNPHAQEKQPMCNVIDICQEYGIEMVETIFEQTFRTEKSLRKKCEEYFKDNMIEGIVLRSLNDDSFSAKYMNNEYDSKK
mgnify:CR=1 FL=1